MQKCPNCGHSNRVGVLICEKCGTNLITGRVPQNVETRSLGENDQNSLEETDPTLPTKVIAADSDRNLDEFPHGGTLWLEVEGSAKSVQLPLTTHNREIVLGRRDPATGALPDVDLTPFAGYRMGVSRRHCVLRYAEGKFLDLFDQGSSNGTYLNGTRVDPHQPHRLHDGDRLRLGQITLRLHFEARSVPSSMPSTAPLSGLPVAIQQPPKSTGGPTSQTNVQKSLQNAVAKLTSERDGKPATGGAAEATINLNAEEAKEILSKGEAEKPSVDAAPSVSVDKDALPGTTTDQKVPLMKVTDDAPTQPADKKEAASADKKVEDKKVEDKTDDEKKAEAPATSPEAEKKSESESPKTTSAAEEKDKPITSTTDESANPNNKPS